MAMNLPMSAGVGSSSMKTLITPQQITRSSLIYRDPSGATIRVLRISAHRASVI